MENQYLEQEKYGNGYRKTYQEGLVSLLKSLKEQAQGKRDSYMSEMQAHPDALRKKVRQTIGWPLTESDRVLPNAQMNFVARDALAEIYRVQLEIQPDVWMYGILFVRDKENKRPLVIAQHGGLGTPEMCSGFFDSENYNDMTRRILQKDVNVFCPQLYLWDQQRFGHGTPDRTSLDNSLKHMGSSIAAVELDGLMKCIDWLSALSWVDAERIGMIGLSYGGFYTLYLTALDKRIKAALCSCYFNDRTYYSNSDWSWFGSANMFEDAEVASLIFPRKLWIQVADNDELFHVSSAKKEFERLEKYYENMPTQLHLEVFPGVHEFSKSDAGIDFVVQELNK